MFWRIPGAIKGITIVAYEPAFGIIGDPAKRSPETRQSADHSMVYIVSTMLRKAIEMAAGKGSGALTDGNDEWWKLLMLAPADYGRDAISNKSTHELMDKIHFEHGGKDYDDRYPDGIPTSLVIELDDGTKLDSGLVMYPSGHARNTTADLEDILRHKAGLLGALAMDDAATIIDRCNSIGSTGSLGDIWNISIVQRDPVD